MLWQPWLAEVYGVRPWEMEQLRLSEYQLMAKQMTQRAKQQKQQKAARRK